jgi:hypothetical protein
VAAISQVSTWKRKEKKKEGKNETTRKQKYLLTKYISR